LILFTQLVLTTNPLPFPNDPSDDPGAITVVNQSGINDYTKFTTIFQQKGLGSTRVGIEKLYNWSNFNTFALDIANVNENPWDFKLVVVDHDGKIRESGDPVTLPADKISPTFTTFTVNLTSGVDSFDSKAIKWVYLQVSANLPLPNQELNDDDYTAEYRIKPASVPEPASVLMLGTGLAMLGFVAGRRKKA
jgi:hypothetical protein